MQVDIQDVLEQKYRQYQWGIKNNDYNSLEWSSTNEIPKPTYEELVSHSESDEVKDAVSDGVALGNRQSQILDSWPIEKQFEALTEHAMGRSEKLNELTDFIKKTKEDYPKSS